MSKHLRHLPAPGEQTWHELERQLEALASQLLVGRRLLPLDGPFGFGTTVLAAGPEELIEEPHPAPHPPGHPQSSPETLRAALAVQGSRPLAMIHHPFSLASRNVVAFEEGQAPLDTGELAAAVTACARREDELIFFGHPQVGPGLVQLKGAARQELGDWNDPTRIVADVVEAVEQLDRRGLGGPYSLALSPARYNLLFRNHGGTALLVFDQLARLVTAGIHKVPHLGEGGLLLAPRAQPATVILGQDMTLIRSPERFLEHRFFVLESVGLVPGNEDALCLLGQPAPV